MTSVADAKLAPGETLVVSVVPFGEALVQAPDLLFAYNALMFVGVQVAFFPEPRTASVALDGEKGLHFQPNPARPEVALATSVRWAPPQDGAQELTLRYDDGNASSVGLRAWFEDGICEDDHPAPSKDE
ncbi:MAG: hypothetical protein IT373_03365 [Polyangiaceae bacterium]|nr:hypothetical protein [Polyangiaceae bacterium]